MRELPKNRFEYSKLTNSVFRISTKSESQVVFTSRIKLVRIINGTHEVTLVFDDRHSVSFYFCDIESVEAFIEFLISE